MINLKRVHDLAGAGNPTDGHGDRNIRGGTLAGAIKIGCPARCTAP